MNLLRLWTGPLPKQELFPTDRKVNVLLHWFIHPIKRRIAKYYLLILQLFFGLKVVALTGSSGKTTTTNLLYSVLSLVGPTVKTAESITTTYNIPTTILKCSPKTRYLILEMGVEYPGDMDFYCWLAKPNIGLVLNVSSVHSSFLGSIDQIKKEKNKLLTHSQIRLTSKQFPQILSSQITKSLTTQIKCQLPNDQISIDLPLLGTHLAQNISAIIKVCNLLDVPSSAVKSGLESATSPAHRMTPIELQNGNLVLDDTYNANPLSVSESLKTLAAVSKIKKLTPVFVFGQMNELGQYEISDHKKIGLEIRQLGIRNLYCLGPATKHTLKSAGLGQYFQNLDDLTASVSALALRTSHLALLIKGSHSWHLEELVNNLLQL